MTGGAAIPTARHFCNPKIILNSTLQRVFIDATVARLIPAEDLGPGAGAIRLRLFAEHDAASEAWSGRATPPRREPICVPPEGLFFWSQQHKQAALFGGHPVLHTRPGTPPWRL
jgi:hypothetical protein